MTSQPDKLFRDALENFQRSAPVDAWERIDANLNKVSNKVLWLKIAAGIALLCVTGFFLLTTKNSENATLTTVKENKPSKSAQKNNPNELVASDKITSQKNELKNISKKTVVEKTDLVLVAESNKATTESTIVAVASIEEVPSVETLEINSTASQPSRTIVYTAEEVNAKYLKKKSSTEATPETKKSSGIQKLMGLTYELKNTENGLGDLRQKKNEILALNFLNEDKPKKEKN